MSKILKKGLLGIVFFTALLSNGSELDSVEVSEIKKIDISLSHVLEGEKFSITDKEGKAVYSKTLSESELFTISIEFSQFEQGVYNMKSVSGSITKVTPLIIVPEQLKLLKGKTKIYNTPVFTLNNNKLNVSVNNEGENQVTMVVYSNSREIDITAKSTEVLISKTYDLSTLRGGGNYSIVVRQGEYSFIKELTL